MTTYETGVKLVNLCKQNKNREALETLYSEHIVSVEPKKMPGEPMVKHGLDAIRSKNTWWEINQQVNSSVIDGPYVNGDQFSVSFKYDVTNKADGVRKNMSEIAVYTVQNDKIVNEEFFA